MFVLYLYLIVYLFNKKIENMDILLYSIIIMLPIYLVAFLINKIVNFLEKEIDESNRR